MISLLFKDNFAGPFREKDNATDTISVNNGAVGSGEMANSVVVKAEDFWCDLCGISELEANRCTRSTLDLTSELLGSSDVFQREELLREQLLLYFVAKKLLKLGDNESLELLKGLFRNEGDESRGRCGKTEEKMSGFYYCDRLCQKCGDLLGEGIGQHRKMVECQRKLDAVGKRLREHLVLWKRSCGGERVTRKLHSLVCSDFDREKEKVVIKSEGEETFDAEEVAQVVEDEDFSIDSPTGNPDSDYRPSGEGSSPNKLQTTRQKSIRKIRTNKTESSYNCHLCQMVYKGAHGLKQHIRTHEESSKIHGNKYDCPKCNYPTVSEFRLRYHLTVAHEETHKNTCSVCGYVAARRGVYDKHMKEKHNIDAWTPIDKVEPQTFPCDQCDFVSTTLRGSQAHLERHIVSAKQNDKFTCAECGYPSVSEKNLRRHTKRRHPQMKSKKMKPKEKPVSRKRTKSELICHTCNKSFARSYLLQSHLSLHRRFDKYQDPTTGLYFCSFCPKKFKSFGSVTSHKNMMHQEMCGTSADPQVNPEDCPLCPHCGRFFSTKLQLNYHIKIKHQGWFRYTCDVCGKKVTSKGNLKQHRKTHEENRVKEFVCDICGSEFSYKSTLHEHLEKFHHNGKEDASKQENPVPTKSYNCKFCHASFPFKHFLGKHLLDVHQERFTYKCDECNKAYISASSLRLHKEIAHLEGNRRSCEYCGKEFVHRHKVICHYKYCAVKRNQQSTEVIT